MPRKPVINSLLVDVDSTLYDFLGLFLRHLFIRRGLEIKPEQVTSWDFWAEWGLGLSEALAIIADDCHAAATILDAEVFPGAVETLGRWHAAGVKIHVVTERAVARAAVTGDWLDKVGVPFDRLLARPSIDKLAYARVHGLDLIIDDKPTLISAAAAADLPVASLIWPYNITEITAGGPQVVGAADWPALAERLQARFVFGQGRRPT